MADNEEQVSLWDKGWELLLLVVEEVEESQASQSQDYPPAYDVVWAEKLEGLGELSHFTLDKRGGKEKVDFRPQEKEQDENADAASDTPVVPVGRKKPRKALAPKKGAENARPKKRKRDK